MTALYAMPGNEAFTESLVSLTGYRRRDLYLHRFPDGESLPQLEAPSRGEHAVLVCTLDRPDPKLWPLAMSAATLRELGAAHVTLVAPYLPYMRQDMRFHAGEAVSANLFGAWLGRHFDSVVTVDPHLHRHRGLADVYPHAHRTVHVVSELAAWIAAEVPKPLIVGPDQESAQWATAVANLLCAPALVAHKERRGDCQVNITLPPWSHWQGYTPVLVDDIIASGETLIQAMRCLRAKTDIKPVCVAVHGIFAEGAHEGLQGEGAAQVATTNSIAGETAMIDVSQPVANALMELCDAKAPSPSMPAAQP